MGAAEVRERGAGRWRWGDGEGEGGRRGRQRRGVCENAMRASGGFFKKRASAFVSSGSPLGFWSFFILYYNYNSWVFESKNKRNRRSSSNLNRVRTRYASGNRDEYLCWLSLVRSKPLTVQIQQRRRIPRLWAVVVLGPTRT